MAGIDNVVSINPTDPINQADLINPINKDNQDISVINTELSPEQPTSKSKNTSLAKRVAKWFSNASTATKVLATLCTITTAILTLVSITIPIIGYVGVGLTIISLLCAATAKGIKIFTSPSETEKTLLPKPATSKSSKVLSFIADITGTASGLSSAIKSIKVLSSFAPWFGIVSGTLSLVTLGLEKIIEHRQTTDQESNQQLKQELIKA